MDGFTPEMLESLLKATASGDWVVAFGLFTSLLTRVLGAGVLKHRIPKNWLPYAAVILGVLTQTSAALTSGAGVAKSIVMGLVAGLVSIGLWETVFKKTPVTRKPVAVTASDGNDKASTSGSVTTAALLAFFILPTLPACATDFPGKVSQVSTAVASFRQVSREAYKYKCGQVVDECKQTKSAASQPTLDTCKAWKACDAQRATVFWSASTTQMLLDTALVLWEMGKPEDAKAMFARANTAWEALREKIMEFKLLEILK